MPTCALSSGPNPSWSLVASLIHVAPRRLYTEPRTYGSKNTFLKCRETQKHLSDRAVKVNINNHFSDLSKISCGVPRGSILGPLLFLLYINDMPRAVHSDLFLYAEDSRLIFQHIDVHTIEHQLNKVFANLCEWFVDNKLSIHFGEDKTKCILLSSKLKLKNAGKFNIMHNGIEIKQYSTYLGCLLDETMSGESMALKTIKK